MRLLAAMVESIPLPIGSLQTDGGREFMTDFECEYFHNYAQPHTALDCKRPNE